MSPLTPSRFVARRLARDWKLVTIVFVGVLAATTLVSAAPVYLQALDRLSLDASIDGSAPTVLNILTTADYVPLTANGVRRTESSVQGSLERHLSGAYDGHQSTLRTDDYLLDLKPTIPEPILAFVPSEDLSPNHKSTLGYFTNLHGFEDQVRFLEGQMAGDTVTSNAATRASLGSVVEAVVGSAVAEEHRLSIGDVITLKASARVFTRVSARIVGIAEPLNADDEYWRGRSEIYFAPRPPGTSTDLGVVVDEGRPPIALVITPEVASKVPGGLAEPAGYTFSQGFFVTVSGLGDHVEIVEGEMPSREVSSGSDGPIVEAVLGLPLASMFRTGLGDVVTLTPFVDEDVRVSARIVGVVRRDDIDSEHWRWGPNGLFALGGDSPSPLPLFVERDALVEAVGGAYPGTLAASAWYTFVDPEGLKGWSLPEIRLRLKDLDADLSETLPGQVTFTGISGLLDRYERRRFFARLPLLLLLTTMLATVLYFLAMVTSYVTQGRETDLAMLRTRGADAPRLLRLNGAEAVAIAALAALPAPFIAMGATALSGALPYFRPLTGGAFLPVALSPWPFVAALGAGLACLAILLGPTVTGTRAALTVQTILASRPRSLPLFHRYYLDIGVLLLGGLIFWELRSRGQLVVGGLFKETQLNEMLLLTPIVFLTAVALIVIRLLPLVLRFATGESPALLHLAAGSAVVFTGSAALVEWARDGDGTSAAITIALLGAISLVYWVTLRLRRARFVVLSWALQGLIVVALLLPGLPLPEGGRVVASIMLIALVPGQVLFALFATLTRSMPAWIALATLNMARNPLRYTWLVILLVLAIGLAAFSSSVGATLDGGYKDRVNYDVATDARVTGVPADVDGWALRQELLNIPGIESVSPAYRFNGASALGRVDGIRFLAVDTENFASTAWYRDDFSRLPLRGVMEALQATRTNVPIEIPKGATGLGLYAKLAPSSPGVALQMVVRDGAGAFHALQLGALARVGWQLMRVSLPPGIEAPLELVSVRARATRSVGVAVGFHVDDIHAVTGPAGDELVLEDFEGRSGWAALPTTMLRSTSILSTTAAAHRGNIAATYTFSGRGDGAAPGIYRNPGDSPLPVVVSSSFAANADAGVGDIIIGGVRGVLVPMEIRDIVELFPTLEPAGGGFILADLGLALEHLGIIGANTPVTPNEFFVTLDRTSNEATLQSIEQTTPRSARVLDADSRLETLAASVALSPLVAAGWKAMALASYALVGFAAAVGFAAYILLFMQGAGHEVALVRSLGLGRWQLAGFLAVEHLVMVAVGMGVGLWAGLRMSSLTVDVLARSSPGGLATPPVLSATEWGPIVVVGLVMVAAFAVTLLLVNRRLAREDLRRLSRIGM